MGSPETQQSNLQSVHDAARLLHAARGLVAMLEDLVESGIRDTHAQGVSQAVIAQAVDLSPGRISQVLDKTFVSEQWRQQVEQIGQWPQHALEAKGRHFAGTMSYPPYRRRRPSPTPAVTDES